MGLFSSKKVIYVSSVAYNLAGPVTDRLNVLKSTVSRHAILSDKKTGLGQRIIDNQLVGPTMDQRSWFRWAKNHYSLGAVSGQVAVRQDIDFGVAATLLSAPSGYSVVVDDSYFSSANIALWAERHILLTRAVDFDTDWVVDYFPSTSSMVIQYADLSTETVSVTGYNRSSIYAVVQYRLTNNSVPGDIGVPRLHIYAVGSGNSTIDALYVPGTSQQEFFPAIPLRIDNLPINHSVFNAQYPTIAKAYKKATGETIEDILTSIASNANVGDIDYATLYFGVELTTQERCGLRYLYEFFKTLIPIQQTTVAGLTTWFGGSIPNPDATPPTLVWRKEPRTSVLRVNGSNPFMYHNDIHLNWVTIDETFYSGLGRAGAVAGDLWFGDRPSIPVAAYVASDGDDYRRNWTKKAYNIPHSRLYWQTSTTTYRVLDLYGMVHQNYVYGGKTVDLSTSDALSGVDEEGFIVPLHYPTLVKMPLVMSNQLALSNRHVVFNCYQIVKIRWYQRGIFKILIGIVIGIISAFLFPGAVGLLGTALQVGSFLGFSGMAAIIIGAAVNALAAMLLMTMLEKASITIFGEEWGKLIGSILGVFLFQATQNLATGAGFTVDWGSIMRIDNLMGLLDSTVDGVSGWIQGQMGEIQGAMVTAESQFRSDWEKLQKEAFDILGAGGGAIDPLMFTQSQSRFLTTESRDAFLQRTLMTGSDLIDLSMSMIEDYVDINTSTDVETI